MEILLGSEAIARGEITRGALRWNYRPIFRDVYIPKEAEQTLRTNAVGAWLWSDRGTVVTGRVAAALHGARWVDLDTPVELIGRNTHPPDGIIVRNERYAPAHTVVLDGLPVASVARTAFDLGRHLDRKRAVRDLDALANATGITAGEVLPVADEYKGARGVRRLREAIDLMDGGAQSPRETWLRLLLIDAGFPRPATQIPLSDNSWSPFAFLDLGWEDMKIAVEYDGDQHRSDRGQYVWDIKRQRRIEDLGWTHIRVVAEDRTWEIVDRVRRAWKLREMGSHARSDIAATVVKPAPITAWNAISAR